MTTSLVTFFFWWPEYKIPKTSPSQMHQAWKSHFVPCWMWRLCDSCRKRSLSCVELIASDEKDWQKFKASDEILTLVITTERHGCKFSIGSISTYQWGEFEKFTLEFLTEIENKIKNINKLRSCRIKNFHLNRKFIFTKINKGFLKIKVFSEFTSIKELFS